MNETEIDKKQILVSIVQKRSEREVVADNFSNLFVSNLP